MRLPSCCPYTGSYRRYFNMAGAFRYKIWDPVLIVSQIITVQAVYYVGLGLWIAILDLFTGHHRSLDSIFKYQGATLDDVQEACTVTDEILVSIIGWLC